MCGRRSEWLLPVEAAEVRAVRQDRSRVMALSGCHAPGFPTELDGDASGVIPISVVKPVMRSSIPPDPPDLEGVSVCEPSPSFLGSCPQPNPAKKSAISSVQLGNPFQFFMLPSHLVQAQESGAKFNCPGQRPTISHPSSTFPAIFTRFFRGTQSEHFDGTPLAANWTRGSAGRTRGM